MNILLVGSGAREHAIARAVKKSSKSVSLYCFASSNNPGIINLADGYKVGKIDVPMEVVWFAKDHNINLAIIGPESPLATGVVDELEKYDIKCVGPTKELAQIESSKGFARDLLRKHKISGCPQYKKFENMVGVEDYLSNFKNNYVIKADGLMGGKGVKVFGDHLTSDDDAIKYCQELFNNGSCLIIEEKLVGQEFSLMSFSDGKCLAHMPLVQDNKRAYKDDKGPNTGGMGSYSMSDHKLPFLNDKDIVDAKAINEATVKALTKEFGIGYKGILYGGFIATKDGVKLIEFNARFGDPEAMNVLSIMETDFVDVCSAIADGELANQAVEFANMATVCKYAVPDGYPDQPVKNNEIKIDSVLKPHQLFLASVDEKDGKLFQIGSRTAAYVGIAKNIEEAEKQAEQEIGRVDGPLFHRSDIGSNALINKRIKMMEDIRGRQDNDCLRLAVLGSTNGTDMQDIIEAISNKEIKATIKVVISNKEDAYILERASQNNIQAVYIDSENKTREQFDDEVVKILNDLKVDLVLLIGFMRILSGKFINSYRNKIINVHPSLLPAFAGGMDLNVHDEVLKSGVKVTGCTLHLVNESVDGGKILCQKWCNVEDDDNVEKLKKKVQALEGQAFVELLKEYREKYAYDYITPVKRVLLSVWDKTGVVEFASQLSKAGIEIISTGNTARTLRNNEIAVKEVSEFTGFPEIMDGRVKSIHPKIHAGILGDRVQHQLAVDEHKLEWIDLVVCNLYPFADTIANPEVNEQQVFANIDIGGPTMIRSAAKNIGWTGVVVDPQDYSRVIDEIKSSDGLSYKTRQMLSAKAFSYTAQYDSIIALYFNQDKFPEKLSLTYKKDYQVRYGENPHQEGCIYKEVNNKDNNVINAEIIQGKKLSYNNINDANGALSVLFEFEEPACVVVKHANPCGVAVGEDVFDVYKRAYNADSLSAFGGIIVLNRTCTTKIAKSISKVFAEIVLAPDYEAEALTILEKKDKMRVLKIGDDIIKKKTMEFKYVDGGLLYQDSDIHQIREEDLKIVTKTAPDNKQVRDMLFSWKVLKYIKSNGILVSKELTTLGIGSGQVSRVDAVDIAIKKSGEKVKGAVLASDAFFPFRDSIDKIAQSGIKAIIQPGGSIKDKEVITACNEHGIAMVFTGKRCFKH